MKEERKREERNPMKQMFSIKNLVFCALCVALCTVLPMAFHAIPNAGSVFCPMHIPVFLCALACGWPYGLVCGLIGPLISSLTTGMPPAAILPVMTVELSVYGLVSGLLMRFVHTKYTYADIYISMVPAILIGRIFAGLSAAFIFGSKSITSIGAWVTSYFVTNLPGTAIQLVLIPLLVIALMKMRLIPQRYPRKSDK